VASGDLSTISGGSFNSASGDSSTVAGGEANWASGNYSFAAGRRAKASTPGSFVWADSINYDLQPTLPNQFVVRATGGVSLVVAIDASGVPTQYCELQPGIVGLSCVSDRDAKENLEAVRSDEILASLVALPLSSWNYKGANPAIRNLGPMAQDFSAAFGLGQDDRMIASGNLHGVALAAIQGLNAKLEAKIAEQARELAFLREQQAALERTVELLLARQGVETAYAERR
jgi:hypothetical protein